MKEKWDLATYRSWECGWSVTWLTVVILFQFGASSVGSTSLVAYIVYIVKGSLGTEAYLVGLGCIRDRDYKREST